jgi:hypothetical protein
MADQEVTCLNPECKAVIGVVVEVEGELLIKVGGLLISKIDGVCVNCGKNFHWWVTDKLLESILSRLINKSISE